MGCVGSCVAWVRGLRGCVGCVGQICRWVAWVTWVENFFAWIIIFTWFARSNFFAWFNFFYVGQNFSRGSKLFREWFFWCGRSRRRGSRGVLKKSRLAFSLLVLHEFWLQYFVFIIFSSTLCSSRKATVKVN